MKVNDEEFVREEAKFRYIERSIPFFLFEVGEFVRYVQETLSAESNIYNVLTFDKELVSYVLMRSVFDNWYQKSQNYAKNVQNKVQKPVEALQALFTGPCLLIAKRRDKLLDYESALSDFQAKSNNGTNPVSKEIEAKLDQTKKDYDALNNQLIEDLNGLNKKTTQILVCCATILCDLNREFFKGVLSEIKEKLQVF